MADNTHETKIVINGDASVAVNALKLVRTNVSVERFDIGRHLGVAIDFDDAEVAVSLGNLVGDCDVSGILSGDTDASDVVEYVKKLSD